MPRPPKSAPYEEGKWAAAFAPRPKAERRYWLIKSEPKTFSFDDLWDSPKRTAVWDGVRNAVARNFLRDGMAVGDRAFFYHSSTDPQAIVGVVEIVQAGQPDATAFDKNHPGYDPKSKPETPTWYQVTLKAVAPLKRPVTLAEIKGEPELKTMAILKIGRLSVTPVTVHEWETVLELAQK